MIPATESPLDSELPEQATFWTPTEDDLQSDEGFGYFRDTWVIRDVGIQEARELCRIERAIISLIDRLAGDADAFDELCRAVEFSDEEQLEAYGAAAAGLADYVDVPILDGLELGVAGATYALSAADAFPAASCRGHPGIMAWATQPVIYVALDLERATRVQPAVAQAGCGFGIDPARPDLIVIEASSIEGMMRLAELLLWPRE
jgi:hypothetical protein